MGTTGTGRLTDYSKHGSGGGGDGSGGAGAGGGLLDKCLAAFDTDIEEVARSAFFTASRSVPPIGTAVIVSFQDNRLAVTETVTGYVVGYLPTSYNYLRNCIKKGRSYQGAVVLSRIAAAGPQIRVAVTPE